MSIQPSPRRTPGPRSPAVDDPLQPGHEDELGSGLVVTLAGGKWELIEPIVARTLSEHGIAVTVYDFD